MAQKRRRLYAKRARFQAQDAQCEGVWRRIDQCRFDHRAPAWNAIPPWDQRGRGRTIPCLPWWMAMCRWNQGFPEQTHGECSGRLLFGSTNPASRGFVFFCEPAAPIR